MECKKQLDELFNADNVKVFDLLFLGCKFLCSKRKIGLFGYVFKEIDVLKL